MIYRLLICAKCRRRAMQCLCTGHAGVDETWHGLKSRAVEVEAQTPEDAQRQRTALISYLRDEGFESAANALAFEERGVRVIDKLLRPEDPDSDRRGRSHNLASQSKAKAIA